MKRCLAATLAVCLTLSGGVQAADERRVEQVELSATAPERVVEDRITGYESVLYKIEADGGQRLTARLEPSNSATYFNLYGPGKGPGDEALANASLPGPMVPDLNELYAELPESGTYTLSVYMMRSAARREEVSDYTLALGLEGGAASEGDSGASVTVQFPAGSNGTEMAGTLVPGASRSYVLGAGEGQMLYVTVNAPGQAVSYQIFNPDRSFLLEQTGADTAFRGQLWQSGDQVVEVINRGATPADYSVVFGIE